jgi:hypothetical protein
MKSLTEREKGFEPEFKCNQELRFRSPRAAIGYSGCGRPGGWAWLPARRQRLMPKRSLRQIWKHPVMPTSSRKCVPTSSRHAALLLRGNYARSSSAPPPKPAGR